MPGLHLVNQTRPLSVTFSCSLDTSRDWDSMGQPLPMPDHLSMKKFFLKSTLNLFWHNLRLHPLVLSFVPWEAETPLAPLSCQGVLESEKVPPEPPFLQDETPQLPQLLLIGFTLQGLPSNVAFSGHTPAPQCPS